ncbi:DUF2267 domain-containing protein [Streptomyces sulphureus]|uniref:DUF2267 domain-containing protein n=1 Tax=Streptomyces sulphureus TaxID=47758 RepID=UPI00035FF962|nr:DUF2267 domain-containing protein [Streptomyces sulphureus]
MLMQVEPATTTPRTAYPELLERVRRAGAYADVERAEQVVGDVLAGLGRQLTGEERGELAALLPAEAAQLLVAEVPDIRPLTGWGFVKDLATRTGGTLARTRWDVGSVLRVVADLADRDLLDRILAQLRPGYALLFGRAELVQPA